MKNAFFGVVMGLVLLGASPPPAEAQVVFLQNDSYTSGAVNCYRGIGDQESLAAKFTASPSQYPYTVDRIRVFGCGGGQNPYNVFFFQDNGTGPNPGAQFWASKNSYILLGGNLFNDILMSLEPIPPPPITSGTVRVEIYNVFDVDSIGFGADLGGIIPMRNFVYRPTVGWSFAESVGIAGDFILRMGILAPSAAPELSILDVVVPEGNTGTTQAVFTVTLSPAGSEPVTVDYATIDGSATAGSDYVATTGTLTFPVGQTVLTISVPINGDLADEPDEQFSLLLSNAQHATIARSTGLATITDDDPVPTLSAGDVTVAEGQAGTVNAVFNVTMGGLSGQSVSVQYATAPNSATAGVDYVTTSGTLTFAPGQTSRTVTVPVNGDVADEADETFFLNLSSPLNATILDGQGLGTILDDDGGLYHTVAPCRIVDTRGGPPLGAGNERTVIIAGQCGVPATARAVASNLTAVQATDPGHLKVYPAGGTVPNASAINFSAGKTRANVGIYGLGAGGAVVVQSGQAAGSTHFILDVYGYFE
jgi:Calx-beta domain-containing protein